MSPVKLEWDEGKNRSNVRKHGFNFEAAEIAFDGPMIFKADLRGDYGEDRWLGLGMVNGTLVMIAFVDLGHDRVRILSIRKANAKEKRDYEEGTRD